MQLTGDKLVEYVRSIMESMLEGEAQLALVYMVNGGGRVYKLYPGTGMSILSYTSHDDPGIGESASADADADEYLRAVGQVLKEREDGKEEEQVD